MPTDPSTFQARLEAVESRIQQAAARSGRPRSQITLVAVSKKFSAERMRQAYSAGLRIFGENYIQEFAGKHLQLADLPDARFHLIGHLQSNKAALASSLFDVVQTADSPKLLRRLDAAAASCNAPLEVLLEVKLADEENKTGAAPEHLPSLIETAASCPHLKLTGLMTMPPWSDDPEHSRPIFRRLAALASQFRLEKISMGMSGDLEVAIEEGSTIVRVGTALFGARPKPSETHPASTA